MELAPSPAAVRGAEAGVEDDVNEGGAKGERVQKLSWMRRVRSLGGARSSVVGDHSPARSCGRGGPSRRSHSRGLHDPTTYRIKEWGLGMGVK